VKFYVIVLMKFLLALAYPFACWLLCMLSFYACDDHQFIDGNKWESYPQSTKEGWFRCIVCMGWTLISLWAFL